MIIVNSDQGVFLSDVWFTLVYRHCCAAVCCFVTCGVGRKARNRTLRTPIRLRLDRKARCSSLRVAQRGTKSRDYTIHWEGWKWQSHSGPWEGFKKHGLRSIIIIVVMVVFDLNTHSQIVGTKCMLCMFLCHFCSFRHFPPQREFTRWAPLEAHQIYNVVLLQLR